MKKTLFLLCVVFFSCSNEHFNNEKLLKNSSSKFNNNVIAFNYEYLLFDYEDQIIHGII